MRIKVHLFAAAAQAVQARELEIELADGAQLAELGLRLGLAHPQLRSLISISRWAVDHQFASLETTINEAQEIALIPPVSGG